jgi:hypothetical protein
VPLVPIKRVQSIISQIPKNLSPILEGENENETPTKSRKTSKSPQKTSTLKPKPFSYFFGKNPLSSRTNSLSRRTVKR